MFGLFWQLECHKIVTQREAKFTNFVEWQTHKLVYRRYAGLFFTLCVDINDNELACLEAIHLFVEVVASVLSLCTAVAECPKQVLDQYFGNVCELDLVFNFHKVMVLSNVFSNKLLAVSENLY